MEKADHEEDEDDDANDSDYQINSGFFSAKNSNNNNHGIKRGENAESSDDEENREEHRQMQKRISQLIEKELLQSNKSSSSRKQQQLDLASNPIFIKEMVKKIQKKMKREAVVLTEDENNEDELDVVSQEEAENEDEVDDEGLFEDLNEPEDNDDEDDENVEFTNLRELTKSQIPWESISDVSAKILVDAVKTKDTNLPVLFSRNQHKISQSQIRKWVKLLAEFYERDFEEKLHHHQPPAVKTLAQRLLLRKGEADSPKSVSKLYTNVLKVKNKMAGGSTAAENKNTKSALKKSVINATAAVAVGSQDNFYNEISDAENLQQLLKERTNCHSSQRGALKGEQQQQQPDETEIEQALMRNVKLKRALSNLKSPERQILYNDWFKIVKKMETDPKFDLEALIRTRGRFTDHEVISYRDRLLLSKGGSGGKPIVANYVSSSNSGKSGNSYTIESPFKNSKQLTVAVNNSCSGTLGKGGAAAVAVSSKAGGGGGGKATGDSIKLTLEKSDINLIKGIMNKKGGKQIVDLTKLAIGNAAAASSASKVGDKAQPLTS
jgi:hypothetical protein